MRDEHGDRMKAYEAAWEARLDASLPIYARIDGRSFSRFTAGMRRPFDPAMSATMIATAGGLVERTHARIAYTQSDEVGLLFVPERPDSDILFGGRLQKLASILASLTTALFTARLMSECELAPYRNRLPHFDCRVCQLPSQTEAANMLVWRYKDARKNAIAMAAQSLFSAKALFGRDGGAMLAMLGGRGVDFDAYPDCFRHGTFVRRRTVARELSAAELARIPEKYRPSGAVVRSETVAVACDFLKCTNREAFVFEGAAPQFAEGAS